MKRTTRSTHTNQPTFVPYTSTSHDPPTNQPINQQISNPTAYVVQGRPFQCLQCPAAFCRKPYLDIHMRMHTGERPFQCDLCMKRFTQKSSLNIHKRIHTGRFKKQNHKSSSSLWLCLCFFFVVVS